MSVMWVSLVLAAAPAAAQLGLTPGEQRVMTNALEAAARANQGFGGAVLRMSWPGGAFEAAAGALQPGGPAITPDASFEVASVSKSVLAATTLVLVEEGLLDLDAPVASYLPPGTLPPNLIVVGGHDYGPEVTLRQCLSHTSGLPDYWKDPPFVAPGINAFVADYLARPQRAWTPDEVLAYVPGLTPAFAPGGGWHYSDTGFLLVGMAVEAVTGRPLADALRSRVFTPLGMHDSWLRWHEPDPAGAPPLAHRFRWSWDLTTCRGNSAAWAGGGVASTTRDLDRFLRGVFEGGLFRDPASLAAMTTWTPTGTPGVSYGLGLFRIELLSAPGFVVGHDGFVSSWAYWWPRHRVCFTGTLDQSESSWWWLLELGASLLEP